MENKFAPVLKPESNKWKLLLINLITLGTLSAAAPFFNSVLKTALYFAQRQATADNIKDTTMAMIGQSTSIARDLLPTDKSPWTPEKQDDFPHFPGNTINGWANTTSLALQKLFDGTDQLLVILWDAMFDGKLIEGKHENAKLAEGDPANKLRANIAKTFFGFGIPALWRQSKTYAFVIDAGVGCDLNKPLSDYLSDETMETTGVCFENKPYYLVSPDGNAKKCENICYDGGACERVCRDNNLSKLPGLGLLGGMAFGGITKEGLVAGSVRTWAKNGNKNGGGPCDVPPGNDFCCGTTFMSEVSDASPLIADCQQNIRNIEGNLRTKSTVINVEFYVGGQDIIDIINEMIKNHAGSNGKFGGKGRMRCNANAHNNQEVQ
ncbi:hypothetical protein N0V88_003968 [Collariella sp. IMI 366227]|nr:hypothetical protein N0V88_003968 [Collariella sp. IMI 366227]